MAVKIVGSDMSSFASEGLKPDPRGYGQNGFGKASSDKPGERTTSGFLPQTDVTEAVRNASGAADPRYPGDRSGTGRGPRNVKSQPDAHPQTRTVSTQNVPPAYGMDMRSSRSR